MEITIKDNVCFICGEEIGKSSKIKAHLIPKMLQPKINIFTYFHKECEQKLNKLYAHQQKKPGYLRAESRMKGIIKDLKFKLEAVEKTMAEAEKREEEDATI